MLIVLPPSETKSPDGDGPALELGELSFPQLTATRERVARALAQVSRNPKRAMASLAIGPRQVGELQANLDLLAAPTRPAIERYTGVLFDALDATGLGAAARERASTRLAVCSALFGLVRADDAIPAYRLSAGSKLPRIASLPALWKPKLAPVMRNLAREQLVIDLRSGAYRALAPIDGALTVRVLSERPDGTRGIVSHFNKATKGAVARLLVDHDAACQSAGDVATVVRAAGHVVEQPGERQLDVVLPPA